MKKYLFLFLLSLSFSAWGQLNITPVEKRNNMYLFKAVSFDNWLYFEDGPCFASFDIRVTYDNDVTETRYSKDLMPYNFKSDGDWYIDIKNMQFDFLIEKKIKSITTFYTAREQPESGRCQGVNAIEKSINQINSNLTLCSTMNTNFYEDVEGELKFNINNNYKLLPLHTLNVEMVNGIANNFLPTEDKVNLLAKEGFAANLYNYQYRIQGETVWTDIPAALANLEKLSLSAKDLFGADYIQHIGQKIEFRVVSCLENGEYQSWSEPVVLTMVPSTPRILTSNVFPVKCFDSTDGSVVLSFDRLLQPGETINGSMVNTVTNTAVPFTFPADALQSSTVLTVENLVPGKYRLDLNGTYSGEVTYSDAPQHSFSFEIIKPAPVEFSLASKVDVFCFNGSDGVINLSATGGQNSYQYMVTGTNGFSIPWANFNNAATTTVNSLPAGTYQLKVRDVNFCVAKENGNEKIITVQITQPTAAIALSEQEIKEPLGYGLSNGYISVRVTGGTPESGGIYNYEWKKDDASGAVITTGITTDAANNPFTIKLDGLTAGKYYLTVKDKNYTNASTALGNCGIISQEFVVKQPDPLVVNIAAKQLISCNISNEYAYKADLDNNGVPDEAEDASLLAAITGGVGVYTLQWQKQISGAFQDITGANAVFLQKLTAGTYKILVKDGNNNTTEAQQVLIFPEQLKINLSASTIKCNNANEGQVSVTVTGGVAPYTYVWNTGDTTPSVSGLGAGTYFVMVKDVNKCLISGSVTIEQPGQLKVEDVLVKDPVCFDASDGAIQIKASGGAAPYTLAWSTGQTGENLSNLKAGTYMVTFTDANGCSMTQNYTLTNPEQRRVDLGKDITLCAGDSKTYDVNINDPGATYKWFDGTGAIIANTANITLSAAGTYSVLITDAKGCTATDQLTITNSFEQLSPEFLIPTHAYVDYTVKLVNTSPIKPEKVEWIIPLSNDIQVINKNEEYAELKFMKTGAYQIGLKGIQGACEKIFFKNVVVEENTNGVVEMPKATSNVQEFALAPNPNNGVYKVSIKLYQEAAIKLRIMNVMGTEVSPALTKVKADVFEIPFNYTLSPGIYFIILETGAESQMKKMIVN